MDPVVLASVLLRPALASVAKAFISDHRNLGSVGSEDLVESVISSLDSDTEHQGEFLVDPEQLAGLAGRISEQLNDRELLDETTRAAFAQEAVASVAAATRPVVDQRARVEIDTLRREVPAAQRPNVARVEGVVSWMQSQIEVLHQRNNELVDRLTESDANRAKAHRETRIFQIISAVTGLLAVGATIAAAVIG